MRLKFQVNAFFNVIGTETGEELHVILRRDLCFNLRSTAVGDIEVIGIIYRPPNSINLLECFNNHLDDINLDNEIFFCLGISV